MEYRPLDVTLVSAKDLKDVNVFSKMDVYAVVAINGDPRTKQKTLVDKDCGSNPKWNHNMKFTIDESAAQQNRLTLVFKIISDRTLGDKEIGEVRVPIKELLDQNNVDGDNKASQVVTYNVRMPNGKAKGTLEFSYKFGDKFFSAAAGAAAPPPPLAVQKKTGDHEPVTAYPAQGYPWPSGSQGYPGYPRPPPPQAGAYPPQYPPPPPQPVYGGYPHPPPPAASGPGYGYGQYGQYGYPSGGYPMGGYGHPPVQQPTQKQKKSKLGGGLGLGLGAGLLGGLLVGDMINDVSDAAAYDEGYMDGMDSGFDF